MPKSTLYTRTGDTGTTSLVGGTRIKKNCARLEAYGTLDEFSAHLGVVLSDPSCPEEIRTQLHTVQNMLFNLGGYLACESAPITPTKRSAASASPRVIQTADGNELADAAAGNGQPVIRATDGDELSDAVAGNGQPVIQAADGDELADVVAGNGQPSADNMEEDKGYQKAWGLTEDDMKQLEGWIDVLDEQTPKVNAFVLPGGTPLSAQTHVARTVCRRAERRILALADESYVDPALIRYVNRLSDYLFILARHFNHVAGIPELIWHKP